MFSTILHIQQQKKKPIKIQKKRKNDVYKHYIEKKTHSKSLYISIANHIYVFNNPAYTTKATPLIFKIKMKNDVYRHYIEKNSESLSVKFKS